MNAEAFEDISDKLRHLVFPILFLKYLRDVTFEIEHNAAIGMYEKRCLTSKNFGDITAQKTELTYTEGDNIFTDIIWLFSRKDNFDKDYCTGFFIDENKKLKPVDMPAFCYFPTKEDTKLQQSFVWLHKFYKWISDTPRRFNVDLKYAPIFINDQGEPAAAYDRSGQKPCSYRRWQLRTARRFIRIYCQTRIPRASFWM